MFDLALLADGRLAAAGGRDPDGIGSDMWVARFAMEGPTTVGFAAGSATAAQHSDPAVVRARLVDHAGAAVAGAVVSFELAGPSGARTTTATTDAEGVASATIVVSEAPGAYRLTAAYAGQPRVLLASSASTGFSVTKEDTALSLAVSGTGPSRTLAARLSDADAAERAVAGRVVAFLADGVAVGSATTGADGVATLGNLAAKYQGGKHTYEARFAGDAHYLASAAKAVTK